MLQNIQEHHAVEARLRQGALDEIESPRQSVIETRRQLHAAVREVIRADDETAGPVLAQFAHKKTAGTADFEQGDVLGPSPDVSSQGLPGTPARGDVNRVDTLAGRFFMERG